MKNTITIIMEALLSQRTIVSDTTNLITIMMMNTIGLSILCAELKRASWAYFLPRYHSKTASDSLAFIEGTGLDIMVHAYGLMYDPGLLRNTFFSMVGDHTKIEDFPVKRINEKKIEDEDEKSL